MTKSTQPNGLVVTIFSTKGGVGKTTLCANLAGMLADLGKRVLLVDADPQPTLSSFYAIKEAKFGFTELVTTTDPASIIKDIVSKTDIDGLDIVYSNDPDGKLQNWIQQTPDGRFRLRRTLQTAFNDYDVILVDSQGANTPVQHAAVLAAHQLVSPIYPQLLSTREFSRGTIGMLNTLQPMEDWGVPLGQIHGLVYRQDRTRESREIAEAVAKETFEGSRARVRMLHTVVPDLVAYRKAASQSIPVHRVDARARATMLELTAELFPHMANDCRAYEENNQ